MMRAKPPSSELYQARVLERLVRPANLNMDTGAANKANIGNTEPHQTYTRAFRSVQMIVSSEIWTS